MIRIDHGVCQDVDQARKLEWLETNGLGGFSSSTIIGLNTRRYHGLLTAATKPPVGRLVLLSKIEETLLIDGRPFDFSANQYPGAVHPQGHRYLREFQLDPFPTFVYDVEGVEIEKRVFMAHGENTTVVEYNIHSPGRTSKCVLELRPLIAFRDYHGTTHQNGSLNPVVRSANSVASIAPYDGLPELHFGHNADAIELTGKWYLNFEYAAEQERGLEAHEDLFNPFVLRFLAHHGAAATVVASTQLRPAALAPVMREQEIERRQAIIQRAPSTDSVIQQLTIAADQFIVQRGDLNTIIAGYHWFADWGRDTMIALPGITLTTGRPDVARNILEAFAQSADQGMLPNRFPDAGESPEYNTVDATLWLFEAVRSYLHYTRDYDFVRARLYPRLKEIIDWHTRGTRYGIRLDSDGLLTCGEAGVQLTWMDAKIGDWVVTPRTGKPVEIQALWYNALCILRDLAHEFGDSGPETFLSELARETKDSFNAQFWNADAGCLYDVVDGERRDAAIRPNQLEAKRMIRILAISGSLRRFSSNTTLLQAAARLAPPGVEVSLYDGLAELPHFNPDLEGSEPATVVNFRARIKGSDGVLISSPEYAHGVPGALKNALDWVVGSGELVDKPVALLNASPRATLAQASLTETITVMSAHVVEEASLRIPLMGRNLDASGVAGDPELARLLAAAIAEFTTAIENSLSNARDLVESTA